ncbi:hypothetical protein C0Q70_07148 [Pomacea canaliculata]|uniref:VWFA domain-containing protein n=1 Tax=Pomacea canaliculata TaxID=400727 RepID=A0A2T7PE87_POMCA|nr:hypothetical protein C0Q70_07148 [Pomacea canaliculata]
MSVVALAAVEPSRLAALIEHVALPGGRFCLECKSKPMEISFVVDASASIWPDNFTLGLNFIEDFVGLFDISPSAVRVSLVTYGEVAYGDDSFGFNAYTNKDSLVKAISEVPYRSGIKTNTSGGINFMMDNHKPEARPEVRQVVIVLTDGNSQEPDLTAQAAKRAREAGLEVFAIGVGQSVSAEELHRIASDNRHVFVVSGYKMLEDIKKRLAYEACDACQMDPVDLSLIIDSSQSIGESNFTVGMDFVQNFVKSFQVNPHTVRVSVVTFGDVVYTDDAFDFDTYDNSKDLLDKLQAIKWRHGTSTNTGAAIEYMRDVQMVKSRPTAAHVCIVITDGQSQLWMKTKEEAKKAREKGIVMYAVGIGKLGEELSEDELLGIAGDRSRMLIADNYAKLNTIREQLTTITCSGIINALHLKATAYRQ